ncbi:MAG: YgeY family selenium metabolism-linked hydrolase [Candidatus Marinimicrobia bacterium]|nr:YgeY family selenium metabolism-linked hydrolase [Candidatus Neomarinimicrobiota bacterium]
MDKIQKIKETAKEYSQYTAECLSEMVKIPSLSGEEEQVVLKIKEQLENAGVKDVRIDSLGNLIARVGKGPKILAFDAHIDTVDTGDKSQWQTSPFSGLIKDGYVHGRGTVDQEGGAASMVTAARILTELNYAGEYSIYFTFTVMEEDCDGMCWLYLIEEEKLTPDVAVITEPTNLGLYRGHRGRMEMEVHIKGLSAHGSAPERGKNVIYSGAKTALNIQALHEELKDDEFLGKGSIAPTVLNTESPSLCAIPDKAFMHIDRRLTWGETKDSAVAEIQNILNEDSEVLVPIYARKSYKGSIFKQEKYFPTWKIPENHPLVQAGVKTHIALFDETPRIDKWTFSTNGVAICGKHKIPCIGFGPGNEIYAHAPNEKVPIEHLEKASAFYALLPYVLEEK